MKIFFEVVEKTGNYEGRATRREFWLFTLLFYLFLFVLFIIEEIFISLKPYLSSLYSLSFIGTIICLNNRRLHDSGRSGWWQLIGLIPLVGWILFAYFMLQPSDEDNKYGSKVERSNQQSSVVDELINEYERERKFFQMCKRKIIFKLGFSVCRHCVYCNGEGDHAKGFRESFLFNTAKCEFNKYKDADRLDYTDLRKIHRCPAFMPVLYNFKGYAINPSEINTIYKRRKETLFLVSGWLVAILVAVLQNFWI